LNTTNLLEAVVDESEYTYRPPRRLLAAILVGLVAPTYCIVVAQAIGERSWAIGVGGSAVVFASAALVWWLWSKIRIVIDSERIRWPLKRRELRWDEVETSKIVRVLGNEFGRVTKTGGKVTWIALGQRGGEELQKRLLARLGLD
jgi:hypothetical protein